MERKHEKYQRLIDFCKTLPPTPTAVAHPCDESSLRGAVERKGPRISTAASRVAAWVIPTNEELMIARHARRVIAGH